MALIPFGNLGEIQARAIWQWLTQNGAIDPGATPPSVALSGGAAVIGTVNQGNAGTAAQAWFTKLVDSGGVNVAAVSAAGGAAHNLIQVGGVAVALGQTLMATSIPVVLASNQSNIVVVGFGAAGAPAGGVVSVQGVVGGTAVPTTAQTAPTATLTNVAGSAVSVQLLALNVNRKGVYIVNDSASAMYVRYSSDAGAATTTSFSVKIAAAGFFEMPNPTTFTGVINAVWDSATGNARITELT